MVQEPIPRLVGYARVSRADTQSNMESNAQTDLLQTAGCDRIFEEDSAGAATPRPVLARVLNELKPGDTLIVTRLDRIARSTRDLLEIVTALDHRGIHIRSLGDHMDTSAPHGVPLRTTLAAVVELERAIKIENTKIGIADAKRQGRLPGNPGLREKNADAIQAVSAAREKAYLDELSASSPDWLPLVRQLRPQHSWENIVEVLKRKGHQWTAERLRRAVHRMVEANMAEAELLNRSPKRAPEDRPMLLAAAIVIANSSLSLRDIAAELDRIGEPPVPPGRKWQTSSVRHILDEAHRFGLLRL